MNERKNLIVFMLSQRVFLIGSRAEICTFSSTLLRGAMPLCVPKLSSRA
jgi:hypothetical protein